MARDVRIGINADTSGAVRGIDNLNRSMRDLERRNARAKRALQNGLRSALVPSIAVLGAMGYAAVKAAKAAGDLEETINKSNVVFGKSSASIRAWAETANDALLMTRQQAIDSAVTFGRFAQSAGLSGDASVKFAKQFTQLAADMASFENASPEDTALAIGAAMRGEMEPIRRFGVLLDDARLRQAALRLGLVKTTKDALTPQQKVLAAANEIMRQTKQAQGDLARTADSQANSIKRLTAKWEDLKINLAEALLPVVEKVLPKLEALTDWAKANPDTVRRVAAAITGLAAAIVALNAAVSAAGALRALAAGLSLVAGTPLGVVIGAIAALAAQILILWRTSPSLREFIGWLRSVFPEAARIAWEGATNAAKWLRDRIVALPGAIKTTLEVWGKLVFALVNPIARILYLVDAIRALADALPRIKSTAVEKLRDAFYGVLSIVERVLGAIDRLAGKRISLPGLPFRSGSYALASLGTSSSRSSTSATTRASSGYILNVTVNALDAESAARAVKRVLQDHDRRHGRLVGGH